MPTVHAVITKEFTFRGKPERWSNGYNLQIGSNEPTEAYVKSLCDALKAMERAFTPTDTKFVYSVGGLLGEDAVYAEEYLTVQNGTLTGTANGHPETCHMAESKLGPKRYLRKYYHLRWPGSGAGFDAVDSTTKGIMETQLLKLTNGTLPGAAAACRPNGALAIAPFTVDPFIRTHQLKRRGKRP